MRAISIVLAAALTFPAAAQDLPKNHFKVIGGWSNINYTTMVEQPFWTKKLPEASKGRITADFTSLDTLGLKGTETLRLLKLGVADFAGGPISFVAGDFKLYDGLDLAGVLLEFDAIKKAAEAYKPVMDKNMQKEFDAKLMAVWPSPPAVSHARRQRRPPSETTRNRTPSRSHRLASASARPSPRRRRPRRRDRFADTPSKAARRLWRNPVAQSSPREEAGPTLGTRAPSS